MPKTFFILLICFFILPQDLSAQSYNAFIKAGDKAFAAKDYYTALFHFADALELKPNEPEIRYKYAEAARFFGALEEAEKNYQKVIKYKGEKSFPLTRFWLGKVKKRQGFYEEAKESFKEYLALTQRGNTSYAKQAENEIELCNWAMEIRTPPDQIIVKNLGNKINTAYSEFGATLKGDTLFYSSYRFENRDDIQRPKRKITKVLFSVRNKKGKTIPRNFNVRDQHTAHTSFSLDGKRVYFTKCQFIGATNDIRCAIYYREKDRRNRWQTKAIKLPPSINLEGFTATHPNIGYDSLLKTEVLYFVSDRKGSEGGFDIWWSKIGKGENEFSDPEPLQHINTKGDEITPFFHTPHQTLFFSSDTHQNLGGFDVFKASKKEKWGKIEHLGSPINTSYNDLYYVLNPDGETGYLSSNRLGSMYLDKANKTCCNDIYAFEPVPEKKETEDIKEDSIQLTITTVPEEKEIIPPPPSTVIPPNKLEDFLPLALYFDNDEPDRRTRRTTTKKNYIQTFEKYYQKKETYLEAFTEPLDEESRAEAESILEEFFEDEVKKGYTFLNRFSEILLERLQAGETVEIFIKGFTSPRAQSDYNLSLGKRRISSLRNHFSSYEDGIFLPFLEKKQLLISERSFGETTAATNISDALEDVRNSIYNPDAARERRVEIVEIRRENTQD